MEKIFGDLNAKEVRKVEKIVDKVEAYDEAMQALTDDELRGKTQEFKDRLAAGETLDDILPEAFAVCREGAVEKPGNEALQSAAHRRCCTASGQNRRDEDR